MSILLHPVILQQLTRGFDEVLAKPRTKMFGGVLGFWSNGSEVSEEKGQEMSSAQRRISID